jgi:integrase
MAACLENCRDSGAAFAYDRESVHDADLPELYRQMIRLAAGSGLRIGDLPALRVCDIDFHTGPIQVKRSSDQRSGKIGPCKNVTAYRSVFLGDPEGRKAMRQLKRFVNQYAVTGDALLFRSKRNRPLLETTVLNQGLYPALEALNFQQAGLHAFRRGCNWRSELSGIVPAIIRQQMGHTPAAMTRLCSGVIPVEQVVAEFSAKRGKST